jgi:beta-barrel assembly-enhancing protease
MVGSLFYNLGRKVGPKVRKARWIWGSMTGTEADAIRLERGVGSDLAEEARQQLGPDPDPKVRQMLDQVGHRLVDRVANKLRAFHFEPFLAGEPNAFALPGGYIFVSRPIVELCRWDESEVAFILAHEMSHVIKGHAIERIVTNSAVSIASRAAPVRGVFGPWLKRVGVQFLETAYSRDHELEADRLGVRLVAAAGYDPRAAMQLLARLAELKAAPDPLNLGEYFSTHPTFDLRIRSIRQCLRSR